jgi:hypothetical protein
MTNYVTDPDLLNELNGAPSSKESAPQSSADQGYVTDPALLTELNKGYVTDEELLKQLQSGPVEPTGDNLAQTAVQTALPAMYTPGATGLGELAKDVTKAVAPVAANAAKGAIAGYAKNPLGAVTDAVLLHGGMPPVYGTYKSIQGGWNAIQAAKQVATNLGEMFSQYAPGSVDQAVKWVNALKPEDTIKFYEAAQKDGLDKTLKNFKAPDYLSKEAATALNATKDAIPSTFSKIGRVVGPIARTLGKVAGPAGLAMNAYDAAEFAREADLGGRLARGEGKLAPQAYKGLLNQNVSGYTPTAQEARNILDSGDERTINIYGGRLKLTGLASSGPNAVNSGYAQQLKTLGR